MMEDGEIGKERARKFIQQRLLYLWVHTDKFTHKYKYKPHQNYARSEREWADGMKYNEFEKKNKQTHQTKPNQTKTIYPYAVNFD